MYRRISSTRSLSAAGLALALLIGLSGLVACTPGQSAVDHARSQIGRPYVYGGSTPKAGFDCSGLTSWAWRQAGVTDMPRTSRAQHAWADKVSRANARPGDLVFYSSSGPNGTVSHVAVYAGNDRIIHASSSRRKVEETSVDYWKGKLVGFGRIPAESLP